MSKTASGTAGDPLVFVISKRKRGRLLTYKKSLQFGKQARGMILVFLLVLNRPQRGGTLPGCEGVWENCPSD